MMSTFNKDDYLNDLPDPEDAAPHAQPSGSAAHGSPDAAADSPSARPERSASDAPHVAGTSDDDATAAATDVNDSSTSAGSSADASDGKAAGADPAAGSTGREQSDDASGQQTKPAAADDDTLTPLGQAKKESAEYLDALQRERAEFVNFRNRSKKEQDRFREHGIIDVLSALLPALDDIDRIREHSDLDDSFNAVAIKIDKAFAKFGVEKFGKPGESFDPTKHEAVLHKPVPDATKETVDTVVEAGYRIGDRVIRAARVVVASPNN